MDEFPQQFRLLTGHAPLPWQERLFAEHFARGVIPESCRIPTGLGKTSVIAVWLIALARGARLPRRLIYVVNRRTVVDQTTDEVEKYKQKAVAGIPDFAISTLRGQFADNREWSADPSRPAVICGTVDMIGSRLLFSGYGIGMKSRPLHAGFLGQDALLVHDEAHLEPAFQTLLTTIRDEQRRCKDIHPFQVMELTATPRSSGDVFELTKEEQEIPPDWEKWPEEPIRVVWQRLKSKKALAFQPAKRDAVAKTIGETARSKWAKSGKAVIVFVRTIDNVKSVYAALLDKKNGGVEPGQVQMLTGTLRGHERDRLATEDEVFARFTPEPKVTPKEGTVYLVCTSAGEVGVDISANHMVCDLTTLDSMAQRFGRVNRRGEGAAEIDVVYEFDPEAKKAEDPFEMARWKSKEVLERLPKNERHDASPSALGVVMNALTKQERDAAFAPPPVILPATDILFDAWALTSIRGKLPGRPPVEPYLHGLPTDWQPPETQVAWREEVGLITGDLLAEYKPEDLLEAYPLKPHELLKEPSHRAYKHIDAMAKRLAGRSVPVWLLDDQGSVQVIELADLAGKYQKEDIEGKTVILPPEAGGLDAGMFNGASPDADDVADELFLNDRSGNRIQQRIRFRNENPEDHPEVKPMHPVVTITFPAADDAENETEDLWQWFVIANEGDPAARKPVLWDVHVGDVVQEAERILSNTPLADDVKAAVLHAAKLHDHGKKRKLFQTILGNWNPSVWLAKSGKQFGRIAETYRHEFGSLLDADLELHVEYRDLILHLIAAHHGRARPHFPQDEAFDPERSQAAADDMAMSVPQRFARLQRKYGRWGLAYLESLLRAADWAASAQPSRYVEGAP